MKVVRKATYRAKFSVHRPKRIDGVYLRLPNYRQQDYHSCGFLAALTVSDYLQTGATASDLLMAVQPSTTTGTTRHRMRKGLAKVGVRTTYRDDLTILNLLSYVLHQTPVIISVLPDGWPGDHWCVVQGLANGRVFLTNHPSLPIRRFMKEWVTNWGDEYEGGAGLICERM